MSVSHHITSCTDTPGCQQGRNSLCPHIGSSSQPLATLECFHLLPWGPSPKKPTPSQSQRPSSKKSAWSPCLGLPKLDGTTSPVPLHCSGVEVPSDLTQSCVLEFLQGKVVELLIYHIEKEGSPLPDRHAWVLWEQQPGPCSDFPPEFPLSDPC